MAEKSTVTRIKATDDAPKKSKATSKPAPKKAAKATAVAKTTKSAKGSTEPKEKHNLWTYLKGAWAELKQVRWPNRKATWSLTVAVLLFSAFFIALILLLDLLFGYIFELIIV